MIGRIAVVKMLHCPAKTIRARRSGNVLPGVGGGIGTKFVRRGLRIGYDFSSSRTILSLEALEDLDLACATIGTEHNPLSAASASSSIPAAHPAALQKRHRDFFWTCL